MGVDPNLTAEEQMVYDRLKPLFEQEALRMAKALAAKADHELFGQNEFEVRDRVHELGAKSLEIAANERQKRGADTSELAASAPTAKETPSSSIIATKASRVY